MFLLIKLFLKYETLTDTTLEFEEINTNVNDEDFDVSQCYVNKPLDFFIVQFGEVTEKDMLVLSKNFHSFKGKC